MAKSSPDVVRINSQGDLVFALTRMLGFRPCESLVVVCLSGPRQRIGLTLRYDLDWLADPRTVTENLGPRIRYANPDSVFVAVFSDEERVDDELPHRDLVDSIGRCIGDLVTDVVLVGSDRWWSYSCDNPRCCPPEGIVLDSASPGATALAAAYALQGKSVLATREDVVASVAFAGDDSDAEAMADRLDGALDRHEGIPREQRRTAIRDLLSRLCAASHDPRSLVSDDDAAEFAALLEDVIVRDEVLVQARKTRRRETIMNLLIAIARLIPDPYDAPVCGTLAYIAYANGDGIIANVALERAFATDPEYSLAQLTADALDRQIPPSLLVKVMKQAAADLDSRA